MSALLHAIGYVFNRPALVGVFCLLFSAGALLFDGSLYHLWNLSNEKKQLQDKYVETVRKNKDLSMKVQQARKNDAFIEKEAKEKLDLVRENEIVFIFGEP